MSMMSQQMDSKRRNAMVSNQSEATEGPKMMLMWWVMCRHASRQHQKRAVRVEVLECKGSNAPPSFSFAGTSFCVRSLFVVALARSRSPVVFRSICVYEFKTLSYSCESKLSFSSLVRQPVLSSTHGMYFGSVGNA